MPGDERLRIEGAADGPVPEFLRFIEQSPVAEMTANATRGMSGAGAGRLQLTLDLPLRRLSQTRVNGAFQFSATGQVYRGPGAPATGPRHHYMFELYALDIKLDVVPAADAFESRANVFKAMQGHVLGKAVYGGLFRRPQ